MSGWRGRSTASSSGATAPPSCARWWTSESLDLLAEGVEYNRTHPSEWSHWYTSPDEAIGFWSDYVTWPRVEQYRQVVFDGRLARLAGQLMGSNTVRFFHEHVLVKEPGATEPTPWHHDDPYYGIDGVQNVSMWIALDPVPASSGLRFIAGSHLWGRRFVPKKFIDHAPYGRGRRPASRSCPTRTNSSQAARSSGGTSSPATWWRSTSARSTPRRATISRPVDVRSACVGWATTPPSACAPGRRHRRTRRTVSSLVDRSTVTPGSRSSCTDVHDVPGTT